MSFTLSSMNNSLEGDEFDSFDAVDAVSIIGQNVAVELSDGSVKVITKSGYKALVTEENLELFGRKVEERLTKLSVEERETIDRTQYEKITSECLFDILASDDPSVDALRSGIIKDDPDHFNGILKEREGKFHEAYEFFLKAAAKGNIESKYAAALYHYHGDLGAIDYHQCYLHLKGLEESNHDGALYLLGQLYYQGIGGCPQDIKAALGCFQRSYALGNNHSKLSVAMYYHYGYCMEKNPHKALELMNELAEVNFVSGEMYLLLWTYYRGVHGTEKNSEKAIKYLNKAKELNVAEASYHLALSYLEGVDVERDHQMAFRLFSENRRLQNLPEAHMYIAHCYYFGLGVAVDKERAHEIMSLYPPSAHKESLYHLGCFARADGDFKMAFKYFQEAISNNDKKAYGHLGICHFLGQGTKVDYKKAFKYLGQAIFETQEALSCLSRCYAEGKGTALNFNAAIVCSERSLKTWPDKETHYKLAELYIKSSSDGISPEICEKIIMHYLAFLNLNPDPLDPGMNFVYYSLASYHQVRFRMFGRSLEDLNQSVTFARKTIDDNLQNPVAFKTMPIEMKRYLKDVLTNTTRSKEDEFNILSALDFAQVMRYDIYMQKSYFDYYINHPEEESDKDRFTQLKKIHAFLYEDLDREWGLLRKDQLRKLLKLTTKLMSFLLAETEKVFQANDVDYLQSKEECATEAEIADSYLPIFPKKKPKAASKPKGAQKKSAPKKAPVPAPAPVAVPAIVALPVIQKPAELVTVPQVKSSSPPKPSAVKGRVSPPLTQTKEAKRVQKILNIAQSFKEAQAEVVAYYAKDVSAPLRRSIEAVFDKKSLSQEKVMALMEMISNRENGQYVLNGNGGARLIVGDLSVGCHAFHGPGDKNRLGFIADLRKLMVALYQRKK